jgi:ABC-type uncharacterized transport system fused permease/ATPase subunit
MAARKSGSGAVKQSVKGDKVFAVDTLNLEFVDVTFGFGPNKVMSGMSFEFSQGKLYAVIGQEQQGKATLLRILAGVLVPAEGDVFIPPHMRVLHVPKEPYCLEESFLKNLIFDQDIHLLGGFERIRKICERLEFSQNLMDLLDASKDDTKGEAYDFTWHKKFSNTDCARLNIARALIMNPECLIMQMPLITFSDELAGKMASLLRLHVVERGLELPPEARAFRRPRTVFFSSSAFERCYDADSVFEVCLDDTKFLRKVAKKQLNG